MKWGQITECGPVRQRNEDWLCVCPDLGFFAVADGMGGHQAGDVASHMALSVLEEYLRKNRLDQDSYSNKLQRGIQLANQAVYQAACDNYEQRGMGATITACLIEGFKATIANAGDSRALLWREGKLSRLTIDHSLVQELIDGGGITEKEAMLHPKRNVITRALGVDSWLDIDISEHVLIKEDRLLLCTDGLTGFITDEGISALLAREADPNQEARLLVNEAIKAGSNDNITIIIMAVD